MVCRYGLLCADMPPGSPIPPMYYVGGPPPPPEALRGMGFVPPMVGPPAYPYFQPLHEAEPEPELQPETEPQPESGHQGQEKLLKQIEFYFRWLHLFYSAFCYFLSACECVLLLVMPCSFICSKDNLCTDVWLRQHMDQEGWVDISLIATFKKVRSCLLVCLKLPLGRWYTSKLRVYVLSFQSL
jgi:la-related protein 1